MAKPRKRGPTTMLLGCCNSWALSLRQGRPASRLVTWHTREASSPGRPYSLDSTSLLSSVSPTSTAVKREGGRSYITKAIPLRLCKTCENVYNLHQERPV